MLSTFDDPTRKAIQINLREFGDTLAGRGGDLNNAIRDLRPLVEVAPPVMKNLASPETDLAGFVQGLSQAAAETAPVAEQQAQLFVVLDTTFAAFADVARPFIQETISRSVPTLDTANRVLPRDAAVPPPHGDPVRQPPARRPRPGPLRRRRSRTRW